MTKRIVAIVVGIVLLLGGGVAVWFFQAMRHVPEFYEVATSVDPVVQQRHSDELLENAAALASQARREGRWEALFTEEQINGWLAVDFIQNYPGMLPGYIAEPRVQLKPDTVTVACRYLREGTETVVSLEIEPYMARTNVVALRIHGAWAGALPVPLSSVLDGMAAAAERANMPLEWLQAEGDPVALVTLPPTRGQSGLLYELETLQVGLGELFVSGNTTHEAPPDAAVAVLMAAAQPFSVSFSKE